MRKVGLDQCPYGAETKKPTGILTDAAWMADVCARCVDARPHQHMPGGLAGKTLDYFVDPPREVWKTALAAEYPTGLCWAWAQSLVRFLKTEEGLVTLQKKAIKVEGNALRAARPEVQSKQPASNRERREMENNQAVGGLRNLYGAIVRTYRYLFALKILAWDERWFSQFFESSIGIPIFSASVAVFCTGWSQIFGCWREVRRNVRQFLMTPPRERNHAGRYKQSIECNEFPCRRLVFE